MINVGVCCIYFFLFSFFVCFPRQAKDGENRKIKIKSGSRGESAAAVNTDITVLIKPSYLVAVRWPAGVTPCVSALT